MRKYGVVKDGTRIMVGWSRLRPLSGTIADQPVAFRSSERCPSTEHLVESGIEETNAICEFTTPLKGKES